MRRFTTGLALGGLLVLVSIAAFYFLAPDHQRKVTGAEPAAALTGASPWVSYPESQSRLLKGASALDPDGTVEAGVLIRLSPEWRTYWRDPGEAGFPTRLDWSRSENLAAADLDWPVPRRFDFQGMTTLGYENEVVLPVRIRAIDPQAPVRLRLRLDYAACRNICVPHEADHALDVAPAAAKRKATAFAPVISAYRQRVPLPEGKGALHAGPVSLDEDKRRLTIEVTADRPMIRPDILIDGPDGIRFKRATGAFGPGRRDAVLHLAIDGGPVEKLRGMALAGVLYDVDFQAVRVTLPVPARGMGADAAP